MPCPKRIYVLYQKFSSIFFKKSPIPKAPVSFSDSVGAFVCHRQTAPESGDEDRFLAAARRLRNNFSVSRLRRGGETVRSFPPGRLNFNGTQMSCSIEVHAVWPFKTAKHRDAASVSGRCGLAEHSFDGTQPSNGGSRRLAAKGGQTPG